ncbi:MAG: DNA polymerase III subunit beta [Candidatus Brocadiia bacterium]
MNISCSRDKILQAFQMANNVIPARSAMPILQNIKITADDKIASIIATDMEVGIQTHFKADIKEKGNVLIPAIRLGAILRETPEDKIELKSDGAIAKIITRHSDYKIMAPEVGDYPDFPAFNHKKAFEINSRGFREMVRKTSFAVSIETSRYALTGLLLEIRKKEIRMVASDGKRLGFVKRHSEQTISEDIKIIVPPKIMTLLDRILGGQFGEGEKPEGKEVKKAEDPTIKLDIDENQLKISIPQQDMPDTILFCRLIDGAFPDYETIIPSDNDKKLEFSSLELASAFRQAALVTTDKLRATKMEFKENKLVLKSRTQDVGEATITMDIKYAGAPFAITFNPDYFIDVLRVLGDVEVTLELKDKTSPGVIKYGKDFLYLVMPMTIEI